MATCLVCEVSKSRLKRESRHAQCPRNRIPPVEDQHQPTRVDRTVYIYATNGQVPITFNGNTYQSSQFGSWSRGDVVEKIGLESNSTSLTVFADNQVPVYFPGTSNASLLIDGIKFGLLGQAGVSIFTAYYSPFIPGYPYGATTGPTGGSLVETKFVGMIGPIEKGGMTQAVITVQDMLYLLNIQVPRRVLQPTCSHTLYDAGCALAAASFSTTGAVAQVFSPWIINTTAHLVPSSANGTFTKGVLTWTSGKNNGLTAFIRLWGTQVNGNPNMDQLQLDVAPLFAIQVGDTFKIQQGCNQTFASCADLQGSASAAYEKFGGQPNVPVPETAIG
jgi:hypothetical protein